MVGMGCGAKGNEVKRRMGEVKWIEKRHRVEERNGEQRGKRILG